MVGVTTECTQRFARCHIPHLKRCIPAAGQGEPSIGTERY